MPTFEDVPLFRSSDPVTSAEGARHIRPKADSHAMRLLRVYAGAPIYGLTDEEAGSQTDIVHAWKRCADLRRLGLIEPTGETRPTVAGVNARVCRITAAGLEAL